MNSLGGQIPTFVAIKRIITNFTQLSCNSNCMIYNSYICKMVHELPQYHLTIFFSVMHHRYQNKCYPHICQIVLKTVVNCSSLVLKFDCSNKFDLFYYGQVNSLQLNSSVASKWASEQLWEDHFLFCCQWYIKKNRTPRKIMPKKLPSSSHSLHFQN